MSRSPIAAGIADTFVVAARIVVGAQNLVTHGPVHTSGIGLQTTGRVSPTATTRRASSLPQDAVPDDQVWHSSTCDRVFAVVARAISTPRSPSV